MALVLKEEKYSFPPNQGSITWINPVKDKPSTWKLLYWPANCRTYLSCYWFKRNKNPKYQSGNIILSEEPPNKENTTIFFASRQTIPLIMDQNSAGAIQKKKEYLDKMVDNVKKNIKYLREIEDQAGVTPTRYEVANNKKGYLGIIFIGDSAWGSNLWKATIYSFFLKRIIQDEFEDKKPTNTYELEFSDYSYYQEFLKYKDKFLSKVKNFFDEHLTNTNYEGVHVNSGFVEIARHKNRKMHKMLLGDN